MSNLPFNSKLGINFSNTFQKHKIGNKTAAEDMQNDGIAAAKLFNYTQTKFLDAALKQGIQVIPDVPNSDLQKLAEDTQAKGIAKTIAAALSPYKSILAAVMIGNEPLIAQPTVYGPLLKAALENLQRALSNAKLSVKLSVPFNSGIEAASYPPSMGSFKDELAPYLREVCGFLKKTDSFFTINNYPYYARIGNPSDVPLDYCLFTKNQPQFTDPNTQKKYYNIFDAMYDAAYFALKSIGFAELPIIVGETGWPTAGGLDANPENAQTFNQNLIAHVNSGKGSPYLPSASLTTFIFEMYDEDLKSRAPGPFETHWGWYKHSGTGDEYSKKYSLDWSSS